MDSGDSQIATSPRGRPLIADPRNPKSLSTWLRKRRDVHLRRLISSISVDKGSVSIIDMGGTFEYWDRVGIQFLRGVNATVTLLNIRNTELSEIPSHIDVIRKVVGNACNLDVYPDLSFDLAHSNSVIEHVETWDNMKAFASETRRVGR